MNVWQVLEIDETGDIAVIKRAYAKKLKLHKPEVDPVGFQLLRKAYEAAKKYADDVLKNVHGNSAEQSEKQTNVAAVSTATLSPYRKECGKPSSYAVHSSTINNMDNKDIIPSPKQIAERIFRQLENNEQAAIDYLYECYEKKFFVDQNVSDVLQRLVAFKLLGILPRHLLFAVNVIELFHWETKFSGYSSDVFNMCVVSILRQTQSYRYLKNLKAMGEIKNHKLARQLNLSWQDCQAAKIILDAPSVLYFNWIFFFRRKQYFAIMHMINSLRENHPTLIGMGVNILSYAWWYKKYLYYKHSINNANKKIEEIKNRKRQNSFLYGITLFFKTMFLIIIICSAIYKLAPNP